MSRIGKMPIKIPAGVTVDIEGSTVTVSGPRGKLRRTVNPGMELKLEGGALMVSRPSDSQEHRAQHGLTRTLLANMVGGVSQGFEKTLEIVGVGFRAEKSGDKLVLRIGFSHPVEVAPLPGISFGVEGANRIRVMGIDKEAVGEMAAEIRAIRLPDSYHGKGIRYAGEVVHLKPGKAGRVVGKK
jgi:large subunit ribosomal protein L6